MGRVVELSLDRDVKRMGATACRKAVSQKPEELAETDTCSQWLTADSLLPPSGTYLDQA